MAENLQKAEQRMESIEKRMKPYENPDLPGQIRKRVLKQWSPMMKKATGDITRQKGEFLGKFFGMPGQAGTSAADLSPGQVFGQMGTELGTMGGRMESGSRIADYFGAQANTMAENAQRASQMGYQALASKYARASQRYQLAFQSAEAEKQRQFQAEQAARSRAAARAAQPAWPGLNFGTGGDEGGGGGPVSAEEMTRIAGTSFAGQTPEDRFTWLQGQYGPKVAKFARALAKGVVSDPSRAGRGQLYRQYYGKLPEQFQVPNVQKLYQSIASGQYLR